jgi:hypothetical protein
MGKIPHVLFQTTKKDPLDNYVLDRIYRQLGDTWIYEHYNDTAILKFFDDHPIEDLPDIVKKFHALRNGAHKSDLFRYYYLYVKGGFYLDSDAMIYQNIDTIVKGYDFVSVISCVTRLKNGVTSQEPESLFQGIIGASPKHEIIKQALYNAYNTDPKILDNFYLYWCEDILNIVNEKNSPNIKLYKERYGKKVSYVNGDDGALLFRHYSITKVIPSIIGKTYTWGSGYVTFNDSSTVTTTWGRGIYKYTGIDTFEVIWNGYSHIMVFDNMYEKYVSTRIGDVEIASGSLM